METLITIIIILGILATAYSVKLQMESRLVIFGDLFDIVITSGIVLFPLLALIISHNAALMFWLFLIPFLVSLKTSFTNNPDSIFYALLSFISKLTIVSTAIFILLLLVFGSKNKADDRERKVYE